MSARTTIPTFVSLALLGVGVAVAQSASDSLHRLFDEYTAWHHREFPEEAVARGDYSHADKITDGSLAAIERRHRERQHFVERLREIEREELNESDRLNYDMFDFELQTAIEGYRFRAFLAPMGGRFGPQQDIPQMHRRVRFGSYDDYANYLTRLEHVPKLVGDTIELMRLGSKEGRTPPRVTLLGLPDQFERLLDSGLDELATPLNDFPGLIDNEQRAGLRQRFETVCLPAVREAVRQLGEFVTSEYIPKCQDSIAATDWPDGEAYYAYMLRTMTTTDLTARQIHEIGVREVARVRAEMLAVIRSTDFMQKFPEAAELDDADLFRRFVQYLRTDPRFYHRTAEELLTGYRDICKRIDAELPRLFSVLPRTPYGVRPIPDFMAPDQTTAFYQPGDLRAGTAGYFCANTYALDQRPKYEMIVLAMHEAVPGHHLQSSLARELEGLPEFRRHAWLNAFGEGWALYAERLGLELGLYEDPYDNFGRLLYEMWRACRLVVDPGLHALGWSREQAVEFMRENTALSEHNINTEVDRYIGWPGQATAYKIGELKIRELRARAEEKLGDRFDLREFHRVVLDGGALPLTILERRVDAWVDDQRNADR
jgi:uncharacterized protein (DUF885 family)